MKAPDTSDLVFKLSKDVFLVRLAKQTAPFTIQCGSAFHFLDLYISFDLTTLNWNRKTQYSMISMHKSLSFSLFVRYML